MFNVTYELQKLFLCLNQQIPGGLTAFGFFNSHPLRVPPDGANIRILVFKNNPKETKGKVGSSGK
jgi:hypothetical protein